jgi:hypothetical protein
MSDEPDPEPTLADTTRKIVAAVSAEVMLAPLGVPGLPSAAALAIEHVMTRKQQKGVEHLEYVVDRVGEDKLLGIVQSDDERGEMLWSSTQTVMASSHEGKRRYLSRVVANAMTSEEPVDTAQLIVDVLSELEGPHIRALLVIRAAEAEDLRQPGMLDDENLQREMKQIPYPILATLTRTGCLRQGSEMRSNGLGSIPRAETLSITGVSKFGQQLLEDLENVEDDFLQ